MIESSVSPGIAFVTGLASFLSACVLPVVPSYLAVVLGLTLAEPGQGGGARHGWRGVLFAALFVLGFSAVFVGLGATAAPLGGIRRDALPALQQVGGAGIALFGLALLGVFPAPNLQGSRFGAGAGRRARELGAVLAGVAFGAGWTPCIGPVLASALLYASLEQTVWRGVLLLCAFAAGLGTMFLLSALPLAGALRSRGALRWRGSLARSAGALLLFVGILLLTGRFASLTAVLARYAPVIEIGA